MYVYGCLHKTLVVLQTVIISRRKPQIITIQKQQEDPQTTKLTEGERPFYWFLHTLLSWAHSPRPRVLPFGKKFHCPFPFPLLFLEDYLVVIMDRLRASVVDKSTNIFKDDPELKKQLGSLEGVKSKAAFADWRVSFLQAVQSFLDQKGSVKAEAAYEKFTKQIQKMEKTTAKIQSCLTDGSLSKEKASVKARRSLNELKAALTIVSKELQNLLPGTKSDAAKYTNFHMGRSIYIFILL